MFIVSNVGISFYPIGSTGGYIFTSLSNGLITKYDTILETSVDKDSGTINVTSRSEVLDRAPAHISLISVDWLNDMLYWLERVGNNVTVSIVCVYMCMFVYVCVCVYACTYVRTCTCVHTCMHTCMHHVCVCVPVCAYWCINVLCVCMQILLKYLSIFCHC